MVRVRGEGVKNVRVGNMVKVENGEEENQTKGRKVEEVMVAGKGVRGVGAGAEERKAVVEGDGGSVKSDILSVKAPVRKNDHGTMRFIPHYTSLSQDRKWATSGMVATAISGDSTLSLQQRVEDVGFNFVVATPMGGDRVFCIAPVGKRFGMFSMTHFTFLTCCLVIFICGWCWMSSMSGGHGYAFTVFPFMLGTILFFKLCVMGVGRFVRTDECTVDKARLDFARILISTSQLEILNTSTDILLDDSLYNIKMVDEWGCNLGEDVFLTEVYHESRSEALPQFNDATSVDEVQGGWELDELVNDFHKEWSAHDGKKEGKHSDLDENEVVTVKQGFENGILQKEDKYWQHCVGTCYF